MKVDGVGGRVAAARTGFDLPLGVQTDQVGRLIGCPAFDDDVATAVRTRGNSAEGSSGQALVAASRTVRRFVVAPLRGPNLGYSSAT